MLYGPKSTLLVLSQPNYDDTGCTIQVDGGAGAGVKSVYGTPPKVKIGGGGADHCYGPLNFYFE